MSQTDALAAVRGSAAPAEPVQAVEVRESVPAFGGTFRNFVTMTDVKELKALPAPALDVAPTGESDETRVLHLVRGGADDSDIAVTLNITVGRVLEIKRLHGLDDGRPAMRTSQVTREMTHVKTTVTQAIAAAAQMDPNEAVSAKSVILARVNDFQNALDTAFQEYMSDPGSETNHAAMVGFMKTLESMFKALKSLDDPTDTATSIVKNVVGRLTQQASVVAVESARKIFEDLTPTLTNDYQREQLREILNDMLRLHRERSREEYNRAVSTLGTVYGVKLDTLMMKVEPMTGVDLLGGAR